MGSGRPLSPGVYASGAFHPADTVLSLSTLQFRALDESLLQFRQSVQGRVAADEAASIAARGMQGSGSVLPHLETIQRAFGHHDVSDVRAHTGSAARGAAKQLGAHAYASGDDVVLGSRQDLHTVAHEAAHVIQQRNGVALKDGMGRPGDRYERHADAVADLVVSGSSAEALLDTMAGAGTSAAPALQMSYEEDVAQARREGASAEDAEFVGLFNQHFSTVLHTFRPMHAPQQEGGEGAQGAAAEGEASGTTEGGDRPAARNARLGEQSGDGLTWASAHRYFPSAEQRRRLAQYCRDGMIPHHLFTAGAQNGTSASQRLLLSSKILAEGHYEPGALEQERLAAVREQQQGSGGDDAQAEPGESEENEGSGSAYEGAGAQRVHARNCGHWVRLVRHYAGVSSRTGSGIDGQFDHDNRLVLGGGQAARGGSRTEHTRTVEWLANDRSVTVHPQVPARVRNTHVITGRRFSEINLNDGDWVYVKNGSVTHSVIFSHWAGEAASGTVTYPRGGSGNTCVQLPIQYRRAVVFSQGRVRRGGAEEEYVLGDFNARVDGGAQVKSVVRVYTTDEQAGPAQEPEDIARHSGNNRFSRRASQANQRFIRNHTPEQGGTFDSDQFCGWLRGPNTTLIAQLIPRAEIHDIRLLQRTNESDDMEQMIRLNERLNVWVTNMRHVREAENNPRQGGVRTLAPEESEQEQTDAATPIPRAREGEPQNVFERDQRAEAEQAQRFVDTYPVRRNVEEQRVQTLEQLAGVRQRLRTSSRSQRAELREQQTSLRAHMLGLDRTATELDGQDWPADARPGQRNRPRPYAPNVERLERELVRNQRTLRAHEDDDGYRMASPGTRGAFLGHRRRSEDDGLHAAGGGRRTLAPVEGEQRQARMARQRTSNDGNDILEEPTTTGRLDNVRPQPADWSIFYHTSGEGGA